MAKTITVFDWPGGGTWGLQQLVFAHFMEELSGLPIAELTDVNYGRSVGAVGATSSLLRDEDNPQQPKFKMSEIIQTFYSVAHDIFGGTVIRNHHSRAVEHDLKRIHAGQKKARIFRENTGNMHLDHSKLSKALETCYNGTQLGDLLKTTIILSQHFETRQAHAHTHLDPMLFDAHKWSLIENLGCDGRVVDSVMCSTAAPTIFDSHTFDGRQNHYVDNASSYGPTDVLLNLQSMHDGPIKFRLVTLGTGNVVNLTRNPHEYSDFGFLQMGSDLLDATYHDILLRDYGRLSLLFEGITHTVFDTDVTQIQRNEKPYQHDTFMGDVDDLDFILETAVVSARSQHDKMMKTIEDICETRIRDAMPAIASTRVTEYFYNQLRKRAPRLTPLAAIPFEEAVLRAHATNMDDQEAFSLDCIKKMAKGNLTNLHNTTAIPPTRLQRIIGMMPNLRKKDAPPSASPA